MSGYASPADLLAMARDAADRDRWTRAAAVLVRQALEHALEEFWHLREPGLRECPVAAQLVCLPEYLGDQELAADVRHAWGFLSDAIHYRLFEGPPTADELGGPIRTVARLVDKVVVIASRRAGA